MRRTFYSIDQKFEILRWCDRRSTDSPVEFRYARSASDFLRKCMNNHRNMATFRYILKESFYYTKMNLSRLADGEVIDNLATEIIKGRIKIVREGEEVHYEIAGGGAQEEATEPAVSEPAATTRQTTPPPRVPRPAPAAVRKETPAPEPAMSLAAATAQASTFGGAAQSGSPFCEI